MQLDENNCIGTNVDATVRPRLLPEFAKQRAQRREKGSHEKESKIKNKTKARARAGASCGILGSSHNSSAGVGPHWDATPFGRADRAHEIRTGAGTGTAQIRFTRSDPRVERAICQSRRERTEEVTGLRETD